MTNIYYLFEHAPQTDPEGIESVYVEATAGDEATRTICQKLANREHVERPIGSLTFYLEPDLPLLDYLDTNIVSGELVSQKLLSVLQQMAIPGTAYPIQLVNSVTGVPYSAPYFFWLPERIAQAIDWERSEVWTDPEIGAQILTKLVTTKELDPAAPLLFRLAERRTILVHEQARRGMEAAGITGISYLPLDVIADPFSTGQSATRIRQQLQQRPQDLNLLYELGGSLWMLHRFADALKTLDQLLALDPAHPRAGYIRGLVLRDAGNDQEAVLALEQAFRVNPQSGASVELSELLRKLGRNQEALNVAQQGVQAVAKAPKMWGQLGAAYAALHNYEAALSAYEHAFTLGGGPYEELFVGKGQVLAQLGRYEEALQIFNLGLRSRSWSRALWLEKASVLKQLGREEEAQAAEQEIQLLDKKQEAKRKSGP